MGVLGLGVLAELHADRHQNDLRFGGPGAGDRREDDGGTAGQRHSALAAEEEVDRVSDRPGGPQFLAESAGGGAVPHEAVGVFLEVRADGGRIDADVDAERP